MASPSDPEELGNLQRLVKQRGWATVPQVAQLMNRHYMTVNGWVKKGNMRSVPMGGRKVVLLDELMRFRREGNWEGSPTQKMEAENPPEIPVFKDNLSFFEEATSAGGEQSPPVAQLGDYNPNANHD